MGVDASAAGLREFSGGALRERLDNAVFVRAAVESLPRELAAAADRVTVVLPWGTLLAAVAMPSVAVLRGIREISGEGPTEVSWRPRGGRFTLHQPPA